MTYLQWLDQTIAARVQSGALGTAVFARVDLELSADHGLLAPIAAAAVASAVRWLGGSARSLYAQGGVRQGMISVLVVTSSGATALISAAPSYGEASAHVLVTGQHGTLRWDDLPDPALLAARPETAGPWQAWIENSLSAGRALEGPPR